MVNPSGNIFSIAYRLIPIIILIAALGFCVQADPEHSTAPAESTAEHAVGHGDAVAEGHGHAEAAHGHDTHGHDEHAHKHEHPPEPPDFILAIQELYFPTGFMADFLVAIRAPFFSFLVAALIFWWFNRVANRLEKVPGRAQMFAEVYIDLLDDFVCGILGKEMGRRFLPFLGTVAVYIWVMNLMVLVPGMMSATAVVTQTFGLSICVFLLVQGTALRENGLFGYIFHLANEPRDAIGWCLAPLFLPLHIIGELIKPVSLALRLWGNVLGEGILLGVFSSMGLMLMPVLAGLVGIQIDNPWIGIPLHFPMMFLVLLGSTIQALVFTCLSTIYISLVLPHGDHDHDHDHHHEHHAPAGAH